MLRNILGVVIGIFIGVILIQLIQYGSQAIYPPPPDLDVTDKTALSEFIKTMPVGAFLLVWLSHIIGAFTAAYIAARIGKSHHNRLVWITGVIFLIFGIILQVQISHPLWFTILDLVSYLPAAFLGGKMAINHIELI